jgi:poly(A) polymerase
MLEEFDRGHAITDKLWKQHQANPEQELDWGELFEPSDFFIRYPNYLSICIVAPTQKDVQAWAGFVESRLRKLVSDMLARSLPLKKIQLWPKKFEACIADRAALLTQAQRKNTISYFIGFQADTLRMRGKQLNVEAQLNNFREYELSRFNPLVPGMDVLVKPFKVKELPKICFESLGGKEEAMKKRRHMLNADPRRQEKKRQRQLNE